MHANTTLAIVTLGLSSQGYRKAEEGALRSCGTYMHIHHLRQQFLFLEYENNPLNSLYLNSSTSIKDSCLCFSSLGNRHVHIYSMSYFVS